MGDIKRDHLLKRAGMTLVIPVGVAVILNALCLAGGTTMISSMTGFNNFVIYTAIVMITTMALDINLNSGRFDFSLGSIAALSSILAAKAAYAVAGANGSAPLMFVIGIVAGAVLGLFSGILYVLLRIPPIITSMGVTLIYEGISYTVAGGSYVNTEVQNTSMTGFTSTWVWAALIIVAVLALVYLVFDRTKFGYDYHALRAGQDVAVNTGVREVPNAIACYVICGALMGVVGFLQAARNATINGTSLSFGSISLMFTAFLPMFIGGYIGRYSNDKLGFFLAALCISMLNSTFAAFSNTVSSPMQSIISAVLLVAFLIFLNSPALIADIKQWQRRRAGHSPKAARG